MEHYPYLEKGLRRGLVLRGMQLKECEKLKLVLLVEATLSPMKMPDLGLVIVRVKVPQGHTVIQMETSADLEEMFTRGFAFQATPVKTVTLLCYELDKVETNVLKLFR